MTETWRDIYAALRAWGAPLRAGPEKAERLEKVLPRAARFAHEDATVFRVLPVVLARHGRSLDVAALVREARSTSAEREVAMFLDLTGELVSDLSLQTLAHLVAQPTPSEERPFLRGTSPREELLARRRTPAAVRRWGWTVNMREDSLRSAVRRHLA